MLQLIQFFNEHPFIFGFIYGNIGFWLTVFWLWINDEKIDDSFAITVLLMMGVILWPIFVLLFIIFGIPYYGFPFMLKKAFSVLNKLEERGKRK